VQDLVDTWWRPQRDKIAVDLSKMSREELGVVAEHIGRVAARSERRDRHKEPADQIADLLRPVFQPEPDEGSPWWKGSLNPTIVPLLLEAAGYEAKPTRKPGRGNRSTSHTVSSQSWPLCTSRPRGRRCPQSRADKRQNSAVRLTCLLALYAAGERLDTKAVLALLGEEQKLERRIAATLSLEYGDPLGAVPRLLALLDDPNVHVRAAAVQALHPSRPRAAVPKLRRLLGDPHGIGANDALRLLGAIGGKGGRGGTGRLPAG